MATDAPHPAFEGYASEPVPQAAVGAPGKVGQLELAFRVAADGESYLARDLARVPFHVSGTLDHDPHPDATTVFVQSPTGGIAQGDRHTVEITVGTDAVASVTTQSATKVLSMKCNYAAADVSLSVAAGGHLDYVPEPTILNPDARYCQDVTLDLDAGASAIVGDVVVPGRLARGERFDFERFVSRFEVRGEDGLLAADATHLDPADGDPTAPGVLGECAVYGTLYVLAPDEDCESLADEIHGRVAGGPATAGATTLPNDAGVVVRALGHESEPVTETLHAARDESRQAVLGVPAPEVRKN
ncbi:urease accessory protein UreD [Halobacteriales archaeon QS_4_62_28]|nr:MAG: urease accessory protein UreD [Halobacteriales archaeon QS_4_62_28]